MVKSEDTLSALSEFLSDPLISTMVGTGIGTCIGGVITWLVSRYCYKRAGEDLRREAFLLHMASSAICYQFENPDAKMKVIRDDTGRLTGEIIVCSEGRASGSSSAEGVSDHGA